MLSYEGVNEYPRGVNSVRQTTMIVPRNTNSKSSTQHTRQLGDGEKCVRTDRTDDIEALV